MRFSVYATLSLLAFATSPLPTLLAQHTSDFVVHSLNKESEFSSATAIDMNGDGRADIVSGAWWYEAPNWEKHKFREVQQIRGRFDDYSNLALDVDFDGDLDIISVNYRSKSLYWCENPGPQANAGSNTPLWNQHLIDEPGPSETGRLVDINGDGRLDVLPNGTQKAVWYEILRDGDAGRSGEMVTDGSQRVRWLRHDLPDELAGHGIGAGDINSDGRVDLVATNGWAEAPENPETGRWKWHADFQLLGSPSLPILCFDVDEDGDTDVLWADGHGVGLFWLEQLATDASGIASMEQDMLLPDGLAQRLVNSKWRLHSIDTRDACFHTLMRADVDGDGRLDLIAAKRFLGHDGRDPGETDPLAIRWYSFDKASSTWESHLVSFGGNSGIDLDSTCTDLDGDGDLDIIAPTRAGLNWIENRLGESPSNSAEPSTDTAKAGYLRPAHVVDESGELRPIQSNLDHGLKRHQIQVAMQQVMGALPETRQRVPLDWKIEELQDGGKYWRLKISFASDGQSRVPAYLLVPKQLEDPAPAMLCLHPTHFELGKAQICGLGGQPSRFYAHELAERGFVCIAPDYPSFADYAEHDFDNDGFQSGTMKAIWDNVRAIDLLQSLPCVQPEQIGVIGHSLGGHNALFTAVFEQRIRCVVSSCGFTAFPDYKNGDLSGWISQRYMPRIKSAYELDPNRMPFDFPEVLAAIAPRPLFVNAPLHDDNFAVAGVEKCEQMVTPIYALLHKANKRLPQAPVFRYPDADHDFPQAQRNEVYNWLTEQWK